MRLYRLVERLEAVDAIDTVADPLQRAISGVLPPGRRKDLLSGTWLGHPVHPLLIAIPIGTWTSASMLDLLGGRRSRRAAQRLTGIGVLAALPTAATGASDWADTAGAAKRSGLVHAAFNYAALAVFFASWRARRRQRHLRGMLLSLVGDGLISVSGYLGGHLSYSRGVGVDPTAFAPGPSEWASGGEESALEATGRTVVEVEGAKVLVVRDGGRLSAINAVCTHRGGPLEDGDIADGCVTCPWHGSQFRLVDGSIVRGPATAPQDHYDVRVVAGKLQLRRAVPSA